MSFDAYPIIMKAKSRVLTYEFKSGWTWLKRERER